VKQIRNCLKIHEKNLTEFRSAENVQNLVIFDFVLVTPLEISYLRYFLGNSMSFSDVYCMLLALKTDEDVTLNDKATHQLVNSRYSVLPVVVLFQILAAVCHADA